MTSEQDPDELKRRVQQVLGMFGLFLASFICSCEELRYKISGAYADGTVERAVRVTSGRFMSHTTIRVSFSFKASDGNAYTGSGTISEAAWAALEGDRIKVVYMPGNPSDCTPDAARTNLWFYILLGMTCAFAAFVLRLYRRYKAEMTPGPARPAKR